ncbi:unnamed protein product [Leptidea sinapis]|uniref:VWFA domain-containing protein n=1 Tax=Leptidea sinapis TaxID=189913 RepID=A0A5E4Q830_9NEOP|nr:unnamed protein product [Leptidea sinapis]
MPYLQGYNTSISCTALEEQCACVICILEFAHFLGTLKPYCAVPCLKYYFLTNIQLVSRKRQCEQWIVYRSLMLFRAVLVILLISLKSSKNIVIAQHVPNNKISFNTVQGWGVKLGTELYHFGEFITRKKEVEDSWKSAQIESRDGEKLVQSMADDIRAMMELKISAVKRIVEAAENMAFDKQNEPIPDDYQFYNSKEMEDLLDDTITTTPEPEFNMENWIIRPPSKNARLEQNAHFSNIPVNINITSVHVPTNVYAWAPEVIKGVHWSEGLDTHFINNYQSDPTLSWQYFGSSTGFMRHYPAMKWKADPVDIYDCRTRAWYMEAAASPKDVVILVDRSGSMTGQRRDIAKHVVTNILDTLGNNDFVNVMTFANTVEEIATLGNIREFKLALDNFDTMEIANFSAALTRAFDLLEIYRNNSGGANCNQAIMLVTDGVPYNYKELFERYNWKYDTPVRVFTYLIGREVADVREVKWMACANKGYYVHLSTLAEVRERVLEHVNVLARPLVLQREKHPVVWTPVYANITDPKVADYLWEQRERAEQKERFMSQRRDKVLFNSEKEQNRRWKITQMKQGQYSELGNAQYQLMTSVSMPVYDLRHNEVGVNGYAFMVTNNGYILIHPDLRPVFQQILKPSYNSVDMIEKRVSRGKKHYFWTGISESPFTLVLAIPENYGRHRITPPPTDDIHRLSLTSKNISAKQYLSDKWRSVEGRDRNKSPTSMPRNEYYCDHGLMQALVYDARNTAWFNKSISDSATDEKATEFIQRFGYIVAFLATHSGLTRWQTHPLKERDDKPEFGKFWPRAIDEVWYRRAIEQHYIDPLSYVYSVEMSTDKFPLNVTSAVVTASHAVFHSDGHRKAPAAVVGFQFRHERLSEWFENITSSCEHKECVTCASDDWECYLVDSNGWIIPLENLRMIMSWLIATTVWFYNTVSVTLAQSSYSFDDVAYQNYENDEETDDPSMFKPPMRIHERDFEKLVLINRTRPTPCDREMYLYQMDYKNLDEKLNKPLNECTRPFYAQLVNYTNMLLVVVDAMCPKKDVSMPSIDPTEVQYNESLPCLKHKHPLRATSTCADEEAYHIKPYYH